ncbi:MAG: cell wall hydrolase [Clostridia bacterium]|nr:cell wall hydrolase [Clostridia bacterium]
MSFIKQCAMFVLCAVTVLASISPATANNYTHAPTPLVPEVQVETESNAPEAEAETEPKQELEALPEIEVKSAQSDWPVSVWLNGEEMALTIPTILNNGITYVSIGDFCRVMGCDISFEGGVFTAIRGQELEISCTSGNFYLLANERAIYMGSECFAQGNELMVPVRAMATVFALDLEWNGDERRIDLSGGGVLESGDTFYNEKDLYWLSRIINAEARGESFIGQIAVGNVVLNRVKSSEYPSTIYGVIFDRNNGVQFTPISDGSIYLEPYDCCVIAAKLCLEGIKDYSNGAIYFISDKVKSCYATIHCEKVATIGGHRFYA